MSRRDIQPQVEQNRGDALRREQEAQHRVEEIPNQLQTLTDQLNKFQPASEHAMWECHKKNCLIRFSNGLMHKDDRID